MNVSWILIAVVAFVVMEPITAATHRWIMHGVGEFLHRSHHQRHDSRWELNDWYPVMFAGIVNLALFAGFNLDGFAPLIPAAVGVTLYGAAYALVHDVYIHQRVGWFAGRRIEVFERLAEAHRIHHLYNAAPYGMLLPVVPAELRDRASRTDAEPARQGLIRRRRRADQVRTRTGRRFRDRCGRPHSARSGTGATRPRQDGPGAPR